VHRIFERAGSVLRGNLKAILGRSRDPSETAAQMVREIEEALHRTKASAAQTAADIKRLKRAHERRLHESAGELSGKLQALDARDVDTRSEVLALQARLDEAKLRLRHLRAREGALQSEDGVRSLRGSVAGSARLGDVERLESQMDEWEAGLEGREVAEGEPLDRQMHDIEEHLPEVEARLAELRQNLNKQQS
jgi:phage shock protein A